MDDILDSDFARRCNAYHEAGHAVAAIVHGFRVVAVDIRPLVVPGLGKTLGSAELALPVPQVFLGKGEDAVAPLLTVLLAGVFAEQKVDANAGIDIGHPQSDGQRAMAYAVGAICKPVLVNGVLVTPSDEVNRQMPTILDVFERALSTTQEFVRSYGTAIDTVGELLAQRGVLAPSEVERMVAEAKLS